MKAKVDNIDYTINTLDELLEVVKKHDIIADVISFPPKYHNLIQSRINEKKTAGKKTIRREILYGIWSIPSKLKMEYWLEKGHSEEYARQQVSLLQSGNSKKRYAKEYDDISEYKAQFNTTMEYWLAKGYNEEEAVLKLKERQQTFSLEKCIERYGEAEGRKVFDERQSKWIKSLNNKSEDELVDIRKRQCISFGQASKESLLVFNETIQWLEENGIDYYVGVDGNKEYFLYNKKYKKLFWYDLTIPSIQCIIEYNGVKWHPREDIQWPSVFGIDETKKLEEDTLKLNTAILAGFSVLTIWSDEDVAEASKKCLQFIKEKVK